MLFEHADDHARELWRIERDGTQVVVHRFPRGQQGEVQAVDHATLEAAVAAYDRHVVDVYARGYRLVRDWVDPPLAHDAELEAMIAQDPFDDMRWMVLADWILTQDDVRAHIVRFEQSRRSRDVAETWGQYPIALFGGAHGAELLTDQLARGEWHAGHVRQCALAVTGEDDIAAFCAAPATRLVRDLALAPRTEHLLERALEAIALAPCAPVLRRLAISTGYEFPLAALAPVLARRVAPALTTLELRGDPALKISDALDLIADSPLRPQLSAISLGTFVLSPLVVRTRYRDAFAHAEIRAPLGTSL